MEKSNDWRTRIESSAMWIDPDSNMPNGVLLSDRIKLYVDDVGLIEPFQEKNLCPASYDLTLGSDCWYHDHTAETGQSKRTLTAGETLIIPPNSIIIVSSAETLNLPFYLTARFNLKLRLLHEGLLVGTGPQVDPGFLGRLSCPLHNISSDRISLCCGETFAVIEFQKTTAFAQGERLGKAKALDGIRNRGESRDLKGVRDLACLTFRSRSLNRAPIKGYLPPGKSVKSSVQGLADSLTATRETLDEKLSAFDTYITRLNFAVFITVAVVAVSLSTYFFSVFGWHKNAYDTAVRAEEQAKRLGAEIEQLRSEHQELTRTLLPNHPSTSVPSANGAPP